MKKALTYLIVFLIICIASGITVYLLLNTDRVSEMPDLRGKPLRDAEALAEKLNISLRILSEEYNPDIPPGSIITQDIPAGTKIKGGEVTVVLSKGPFLRAFPSVIGLSIDEAKKLYQKEHIPSPEVIYVHSDSVVRDKVIAQGSLISDNVLIVSAGPYDVTYYCPDFVGMTKDEAVRLAAELGLNAVFNGEEEGLTDLNVKSQSPEAKTKIKQGATVRLSLSQD